MNQSAIEVETKGVSGKGIWHGGDITLNVDVNVNAHKDHYRLTTISTNSL